MMKVPKSLIVILLIQGVVFGGIGGYMMSKSLPYILNGEEIQGTVTEILTSHSDGSTMYSQRYSYITPLGEVKKGKSSGSSSHNSYNKGDSIDLLYNLDRDTAKINGFFELYFGAIFLSVGVLEMLILVFLCLKASKNRKKRDELIATGVVLGAEIISVDSGNVRVNNKKSYKIISQAKNENDGKIYVFKSEGLFFKPTFEEGEKIAVYVKPMDYSSYYVDVRELREKYVYA